MFYYIYYCVVKFLFTRVCHNGQICIFDLTDCDGSQRFVSPVTLKPGILYVGDEQI